MIITFMKTPLPPVNKGVTTVVLTAIIANMELN